MSTRDKDLGKGAGGAKRLLPAFALLMLGAGSALAQTAGPTVAESGSWQEIANLIVQPGVTITLLAVGCLLLFIDLLTLHTWGLAGTLGVIGVALVFAAHITAGSTGGWVGVILALAGLTLLLLETHVFPGHGIAAVAGLLLLFLGMFWALGGSNNAAFALSVSTILTTVSIIGFFAYLPKSPVWKKLGQQMQQRASLGYVTSESRMHFLGRIGKAATVLRPAGLADIDGVRLDVVTEGEFLEVGTPVVVIRVEGGRIVVDNVEAQSAAGQGDAAAEGRQTRAA